MEIGIDKYKSSYSLRLYKNASLVDELEQVENFASGSKVYDLTKFTSMRLYKVFSNNAGVFTEVTGYKTVNNKLYLPAAAAHPILCVPKGYLALLQIKGVASGMATVYIGIRPGVEYKNMVVTTLDPLTGSPGPYLFSLDGSVWTTSISAAVVPTKFFVKGSLAAPGQVMTLPLIVSTDIFL